MTVTIILSWTGQDAATVRAAISIKDDLVGPASLNPRCILLFGNFIEDGMLNHI